MPEKYAPIDTTWPARREAWKAHYMAKGCSDWKARSLAEKKRFKRSMPHDR